MDNKKLENLKLKIDLVKNTDTDSYGYFQATYEAFEYILKHFKTSLVKNFEDNSLYESFIRLIVLKKAIEERFDADFRDTLQNEDMKRLYSLLLTNIHLMKREDWGSNEDERIFLKNTNYKFHLENIYTNIRLNKDDIENINVDYEYNEDLEKGTLRFGNLISDIPFTGERAKILLYFYNMGKVANEKYFGYQDVKTFMLNKTINKTEIEKMFNSVSVRQAVDKINERVATSGIIKSIIEKNKKPGNTDDKTPNLYRWKIEF